MSLFHFTEYLINGKTYIDLKEVRVNCKQYCKGTRSMAQLIERKNLRDTIYGLIKDGTVVVTETLSRQRGTTFVVKEELAELFIVEANASELPLAPPVIKDKDLIFFKDEDGGEYDVLMRGERTRKGIYFKMKDVERVFQMKRLDKTLQKEHTGYQVNIDYLWFIVFDGDNVPMQLNGTRELYLTYEGLIRVIYRSNSGVASQFRNWIDECVFAMNWGTKEQKIKVATRALNVDAEHLKAIMSKCPTAITCLYLLDILISENGKRVFKYGFTKNLQRRFNEHIKTYGENIKLDTFIFIPELDLSKAEATFRKSISKYQYVEIDGKDELISLCDEAYANVQTMLSTIMSKHCGNFREQNAYYQSKYREFEADIIINEERCKRIIAEKDCEVYKLQIQILELKLQM